MTVLYRWSRKTAPAAVALVLALLLGTESQAAPPPPPPPGSHPLPRPPKDPLDLRPGPGRMWTLAASTLTLSGPRYHGIEEQDVLGRQVRVLHFTVDRIRLDDLVQRGLLLNGAVEKLSATTGARSTVDNGPIELYVTRLDGTLTVPGLPPVPITLTPDSLLLPDVDLSFLRLPELTFTGAAARVAELRGGNLHVPSCALTVE